jgi:hypothetical protein
MAQSHDYPWSRAFLGFLRARRCSPNTEAAYACDEDAHFFSVPRSWADRLPRVHACQGASAAELPARTTESQSCASPAPRPCRVAKSGPSRARLAPSTVNHIISPVSAFYEYLILADQWTTIENPILKVPDQEHARVSDTHRPFHSRLSSPRRAGMIERVHPPDGQRHSGAVRKHRPQSSSGIAHRPMRVLGPIVQPLVAAMLSVG